MFLDNIFVFQLKKKKKNLTYNKLMNFITLIQIFILNSAQWNDPTWQHGGMFFFFLFCLVHLFITMFLILARLHEYA